jgi:hypothetical protein
MDRVKVVHLIGKAIWYWLVNNQLYQRSITTLFLNCVSIYEIQYGLKIDPQKGLWHIYRCKSSKSLTNSSRFLLAHHYLRCHGFY